MEQDSLYPIGKACRICGVSPRTLRYYEEIGLLLPDHVDEESGYRSYTTASLRRIQQICSLSADGFSLQEIGQILEVNRLDYLRGRMAEKISAVQESIQAGRQRLSSLYYWHALLVEGEWVLAHDGLGVTAKYLPPRQYMSLHNDGCGPDPCTDYMNAVKRSGQSPANVLGALYGVYEDYRVRMQDQSRPPVLLGRLYRGGGTELVSFGGFTAVACYHVGDLSTVGETYAAMAAWAEAHRFPLQGSCCERYVLDAYSTPRKEEFVTELLLPVQEDVSAFRQAAAFREPDLDVT